MTLTPLQRITAAAQAIEAAGYTIRYVDFCEDADTPGILGGIAGATNHKKHTVKIATKYRSHTEIADTIEHELHHVQDPTWDCGNRDALGRGGSRRCLGSS